MTTRAVEQIDQWDSRPFSDGYRSLHDLSDDGFSGIVAAGPARLCMTKGNVVGILDGSIEDFEDASGTVYAAPSPALALLAVMQERSDEVRAQYYTEDTPLEEVDRTLVDGNFTGYIELAENVLSGDYYQVYHQGRSMSVAFVGASERLLTGDEAFEKANGEVGIYEVRPVDIETVDIPEPEDTAESAATASVTAEPEADSPGAVEPDAGGETGSDAETGPAAEPDAEPEADADPVARESAADQTGSAGADGPTNDADTRREGEQPPESDRRDPDADPGPGRDVEAATEASDPQSADPAPDGREPASQREQESVRRPERRQSEKSRPSRERQSASRSEPGTRRAGGGGEAGSDRRQPAAGPQESVDGLETRSVPSLDPDRTSRPDDGASQGEASNAGSAPRAGPHSGTAGERPARENAGQRQPATGAGTPDPSSTDQRRDQPHDSGASDDRSQAGQGGGPAAGTGSGEIERLQAELDDREAEIERLEGKLESVESERDELEGELQAVREERDELREQVERLERRVDELRTGNGGESVADRRRLSPGEAIDDTNLFIRYRSKGDATLEAAFEGRAEASTVNENLEIQYHTQFEADEVAVDGEPFAAFLTGTIQYRFVEWVVRVLPYEIRDTGHEGALKDLYEALPRIDRAELNGAVSVIYQEDGENHRSQETFDVVLRDRMGNPLVVANINESREPASREMMETLITAAQRVGESKESLAGGFLVTSSFFEPEAMEAAADATGSGLLSRDKRESFVKLSRKDGFHLCLVEAREEKFNLSVPEI